MAKQIPLTGGGVAIVDDQDFERLSRYKWQLERGGYAVRKLSKRHGSMRVHMSHAVFAGSHSRLLDHINGNRLDNRRSNLREATALENSWNRRKMKGTTSRFKGVCWRENIQKWRAYIYKSNVYVHLGYFESETQAAKAYDREAIRTRGKFAKLNFPNAGSQLEGTV